MELINITINIHYTFIIFIICLAALVSRKLIKYIIEDFKCKKYKLFIIEVILTIMFILVDLLCFSTSCASYIKVYKVTEKSKAVEFIKDNNNNCQIIEKDNELYLIEEDYLNKDFTFMISE